MRLQRLLSPSGFGGGQGRIPTGAPQLMKEGRIGGFNGLRVAGDTVSFVWRGEVPTTFTLLGEKGKEMDSREVGPVAPGEEVKINGLLPGAEYLMEARTKDGQSLESIEFETSAPEEKAIAPAQKVAAPPLGFII